MGQDENCRGFLTTTKFIAYLLELKWWDWDIEKIEANFEALSSGDLSLIRKIDQ